MNNTLTISLVQTDTIWQDVSRNLERLSLKLDGISNDADVVILPELFSTGFTMEADKVAEPMNGKAVLWMQQQASKKHCLVIGSLLIRESGNNYNRLIVAFPSGELKYLTSDICFLLPVKTRYSNQEMID